MHGRTNRRDGASLVWVPGGVFLMGSALDSIRQLWAAHGWDEYWFGQIGGQLVGKDWVGELYPHEVELTSFWMYRDPGTIGQYFRFMQQTGHPAPVHPIVHGPDNGPWGDDRPLPGTEHLPVSSVSWEDAVAY